MIAEYTVAAHFDTNTCFKEERRSSGLLNFVQFYPPDAIDDDWPAPKWSFAQSFTSYPTLCQMDDGFEDWSVVDSVSTHKGWATCPLNH